MDLMGEISTPDIQIYSDATYFDINMQLKAESWMQVILKKWKLEIKFLGSHCFYLPFSFNGICLHLGPQVINQDCTLESNLLTNTLRFLFKLFSFYHLFTID